MARRDPQGQKVRQGAGFWKTKSGGDARRRLLGESRAERGGVVAATINVSLNGEEAVFAFSPIDRAALYGRRRRLALDETGSPCARASLLEDGSMLLKSGMSAQGYFLPDGTWVAQGELEAILSDGTAATQVASTLGETQALQEVSPEQLLDLHVHNVYLLEPESVPESLGQALQAGRLFLFRFNFRADYSCETGVLLANDEGMWALIGNPLIPDWQELSVVTSFTDASDDEADDDLDFEMF